MSATRAALLDRLTEQPEPTTLAALAAATGSHPNTLREHLDGLVKRGLVHRRRSDPSGRGRPAWLYEAVLGDHDDHRGGPEYAGLAATLASAIHRSSSTPREDAMLAGTEWGRELARGSQVDATPEQSGARDQVIELLDQIGFAPVPAEGAAVRLTRCPLLEAAHRYPDVVCAVHLGIVRGALEEYGADGSASELFPFSEPGACRLELVTEQADR